MKSKIILILFAFTLVTGCGKKLGPVSPDIWPPYVVQTSAYKGHINLRFNEPIITDKASITLLGKNGDTIPVLDTVTNLQDYSISLFFDNTKTDDSLYVMVKGITDSSLNKMKQFNRVFGKSIKKDSLFVSKLALKRLRHKKYVFELDFNMPVKKKKLSIIAYPQLIKDSNITFENLHRISFVVSDTPDFVLVPDNIYSISGENMQYPYLKVYKRKTFIKTKLKLTIKSAKDSSKNYIVFLASHSIDIFPMGKSAMPDSILSDTCTLFAVSKDNGETRWEKMSIKGDSVVIFDKMTNDDTNSLWRNIIDKLLK